MKRLRPLELMIAALLLSTAHLAACTPVFSFSVYNDASIIDDESTIYGYTSTEDSSTLCSCVHSGYEAIAAVYDPDGTLLGDSEVSGFSSSVSASMDGVSGDYRSNGAGVAYCSCLQGDFGGGGTIYYVAATCPTTSSITSQTPAVLSASLQNNFPTIQTGVGMTAIVTVGPGSPASYNGTMVTESVTSGSSDNCPANISRAAVCLGSSVFTVGPNAGSRFYGNLL